MFDFIQTIRHMFYSVFHSDIVSFSHVSLSLDIFLLVGRWTTERERCCSFVFHNSPNLSEPYSKHERHKRHPQWFSLRRREWWWQRKIQEKMVQSQFESLWQERVRKIRSYFSYHDWFLCDRLKLYTWMPRFLSCLPLFAYSFFSVFIWVDNNLS